MCESAAPFSGRETSLFAKPGNDGPGGALFTGTAAESAIWRFCEAVPNEASSGFLQQARAQRFAARRGRDRRRHHRRLRPAANGAASIGAA